MIYRYNVIMTALVLTIDSHTIISGRVSLFLQNKNNDDSSNQVNIDPVKLLHL